MQTIKIKMHPASITIEFSAEQNQQPTQNLVVKLGLVGRYLDDRKTSVYVSGNMMGLFMLMFKLSELYKIEVG